jgi:hypothetical protein
VVAAVVPSVTCESSVKPTPFTVAVPPPASGEPFGETESTCIGAT